jgi:hypothetical protein
MPETQTSPEKDRFRFPSAVFKGEVLATYDDEKLMRRSLGWLKNRGLYTPELLFAGFSGASVYKRGGFGDRVDTFAVTEQEWKDDLEGKTLAPGNANPFNHALYHGSKLIALGVFDRDKLLEIYDHPEYATAMQQGDGHDVMGLPDNLDPHAHFVSVGGESLDSAAVAVLFFKNES